MGILAERALMSIRTGAINQEVKTEPLPPGVYWIDVFDDSTHPASIATFRDWVSMNSATVELLREEEYNASADWNIFETDPHRFWFLFRVNAPTSWKLEIQLGYPSEGHADMVSGDTIQKPDPPPTIFDDEFEFPSWMVWAGVGAGALIVGGIVFSLVRR